MPITPDEQRTITQKAKALAEKICNEGATAAERNLAYTIATKLVWMHAKGKIANPERYIAGRTLTDLQREFCLPPKDTAQTTDEVSSIRHAFFEEFPDASGKDKERLNRIATKAAWAIAKGKIKIEDILELSLEEIEGLLNH